LALGTARQLLQVNAGATDVEWASNIAVPGYLSAGLSSIPGASHGTGDVVLPHAKSIRSVNAGTSDTDPLISMNNTAGQSLCLIGGGYDGSLNANIRGVVEGSLLAAASAANGTLQLDKTNNRLVYYVGDLRFHLTGVAF
jgi:hypothetical protein